MAERLDALEARLRALGEEPVPPEVQARHLAAIAAVPEAVASAGRRLSARLLRAAASAVVAGLVGGTALASAGALPDPAQRVAHNVLGAVGIDVPDPADVEQPDGPIVSSELPDARPVDPSAGSPSPTAATPEAGGSTGPDSDGAPDPVDGGPTTPPAPDGGSVGPPVVPEPGVEPGGTTGRPEDPPPRPSEGDVGPGGSCTGPPPWVSNPDMTDAERDAARDDRRARCTGRPQG